MGYPPPLSTVLRVLPMSVVEKTPFREVVTDETGAQRLILRLHSGQTRAWESKKRLGVGG